MVPDIDEVAMSSLGDTLRALRECKPNDRSERDRRYAVTITEMEKVLGYFHTWVIATREATIDAASDSP